MCRIVFLISIVSFIGMSQVHAMPITQHVREITDMDKMDIRGIVKLFGKQRFVKALDTPEQITEALKIVQGLVNLPITGILDEATSKILQQPRCGNTDPEDTTSNHSRRKRFTKESAFNTTNLFWSFSKQTMTNPDIAQIRRLITKVFKTWTRNTPLNITEVLTPDRSHIQVSFERGDHNDGYPFNRFDRVLAHAFYPSTENKHLLHFNAEQIWSMYDDPDPHGLQFAVVALHEIGHILGLGHSAANGSIMNSMYKADRVNPFKFDRLSPDDQLGIYELYNATVVEWGYYNATALNPRIKV